MASEGAFEENWSPRVGERVETGAERRESAEYSVLRTKGSV